MAELILICLLGALIFWFWMFADCLCHEPKSMDKGIWFSIMLLLNVAGAFAYLCLRYKENRGKDRLALQAQEVSQVEKVKSSQN